MGADRTRGRNPYATGVAIHRALLCSGEAPTLREPRFGIIAESDGGVAWVDPSATIQSRPLFAFMLLGFLARAKSTPPLLAVKAPVADVSAAGEIVKHMRHRNAVAESEPIRDRLATWSAEVWDRLTDARPTMPVGIEDRPADAWEPLLAVADVAGGDWPRRSREAATVLKGQRVDSEPSMGVRLLADIQTAFTVSGCARMTAPNGATDAGHLLGRQTTWPRTPSVGRVN